MIKNNKGVSKHKYAIRQLKSVFITIIQLFKEVYAHISGQASGPPLYPTFKDGLREMVLCEAIMDSNSKRAWVEVG